MTLDELKEEISGAAGKAAQEMINNRANQLQSEFWRGALCGLDIAMENLEKYSEPEEEKQDDNTSSDEDEAV